jgi:hypothetical protein
MILRFLQHSYKLRPLWPIIFAAVLAVPFGCSDQSSAPESPSATGFDYPSSLGTRWNYQYHYLYTGGMDYQTNRYTLNALHTWQVKSVTTNQDTAVAIVSVMRIDTVHVVHVPWDPNLWRLDTTYILVDTVSFPMVSTPTTIVSQWSKTLSYRYGDWIHTVPRGFKEDTLKLAQVPSNGYFKAWYVNGVGLYKYAGSIGANFYWADTLLLVGFAKK